MSWICSTQKSPWHSVDANRYLMEWNENEERKQGNVA